MEDVHFAADKLKALREEAGLSIQEVADALGVPKSTYAAKEDRAKFKKPYLDQTLVEKLANVFERRGVPRNKTWATLAGGALMEGGSQYRPSPEAGSAADSKAREDRIIRLITADPLVLATLLEEYRRLYADEAVAITEAELVDLALGDYAGLIVSSDDHEGRMVLLRGMLMKQRRWLSENKHKIGVISDAD